MDLTFFTDCPKCKAPGPHHAEYREYQPPSGDYEPPDETVDIVSWSGQVIRRHAIGACRGTPGEPEHIRYGCSVCAHEWRLWCW